MHPLPDRYARWREDFDVALGASLRPHMSVLDIGSGRKPTIPLERRPEGCTYVGLDLSAEEIASAPPGSYDEAVVSDVSEFQPELVGRFDLAVSFQVFEHVQPLAVAFANIYEYLRSGGILVAYTAGTLALHALANRALPTALGRVVLEKVVGFEKPRAFPAYYDKCWYGALRKVLGSWSDVDIVPLYLGAEYLSFAPPLQAAYLSYEEWARRGDHRNLATHYVLRASKPVDLFDRSRTTAPPLAHMRP
jgi:SAM-dependent methyltransferase